MQASEDRPHRLLYIHWCTEHSAALVADDAEVRVRVRVRVRIRVRVRVSGVRV